MRKSFLVLVIAVFAASLVAGCATAPSPVPGLWFLNVQAPLPDATTATDATQVKNMGSATAQSILGLIATGNASIDAALKDGGITKVHHVDYHSRAILGIFSTFTVNVYGE